MTEALSAADRLDYLSSGRRPWILLVLLALALYVPGLAVLPPVDRDEARYIQATRQMLETGDFIRIRYQDEARNKKPVGIYWLQSAAVSLLSRPDSIAVWPYRLVSVLGALAAVLLTFYFGARIFDRQTGLVGAGLLAGTLEFVVQAHFATTDAVQLALVVAGQGALGSAYLAQRRGESIGLGTVLCFWLAQGLALLVKGPILPLISALTILALWAFDRRLSWLPSLRPIWGVPLALAVVLPWLIAIELATKGAFLQDSVGHDLLGKVAGAQEAHGALPGYYLLLLPATFWPASLFLGAGGVWLWRGRRLPAARLLAAWILPAWILMELVPTKLPQYVLPLYPALALVAGRAALALGEEGLVLPPLIARLVPALWGLVAMVLGGLLLVLPFDLGAGLLTGGAIAAVTAVVGVWHVMVRERLSLRPASAAAAIMVGLLVIVPGLETVLPDLDTIWLSRSAERLVATVRQPDEMVSASGYAEPSLVFLLGTKTLLADPETAANALVRGRVGLSLVAAGDDPRFQAALSAQHALVQRLGQVQGLDYSNGKWLTLTLYRLDRQ